MKKILPIFTLLLFAANLAACGTTSTETPPPAEPTAIPPTVTPIPTNTPTPIPCNPNVYNQPREIIKRGWESLKGGLASVSSADFTGDGLDDVILTRLEFGSAEVYPIEILLNDGNGNLIVGTAEVISGPIPTVQNPRQYVFADFNGDGVTDIFVADHGKDADPFPGYQNTLVLSAPDGKLVDATANLPQQYDFTHSAAAGDVDSDGDEDLFIGNFAGMGDPQIWINDDKGIFSVGEGRVPDEVNAKQTTHWTSYTSGAFVDVNNDGSLDLILGGFTYAESKVLLNDGNGYFSILPDAYPPKPFHDENQALDIKPVDINGDGYQDLIVGYTIDWYYIGKYIRILINNGDGSFRDETDARLPQLNDDDDWIIRILLYDIDYDGDLDIATKVGLGQNDWENYEWDYPIFFLNDGKGYFTGADIDHHIMVPEYYTLLLIFRPL